MEQPEILLDAEFTQDTTSVTVLGDSFEKASKDMTEAGSEVISGVATIGAAVLVIATINSRVRARIK